MPSEGLGALDKAITPKVKAVYAESIGNPKLDVADLDAISDLVVAAEMADDRIAVVADGRIAELGSHDELLALRGKYAALDRGWQRSGLAAQAV